MRVPVLRGYAWPGPEGGLSIAWDAPPTLARDPRWIAQMYGRHGGGFSPFGSLEDARLKTDYEQACIKFAKMFRIACELHWGEEMPAEVMRGRAAGAIKAEHLGADARDFRKIQRQVKYLHRHARRIDQLIVELQRRDEPRRGRVGGSAEEQRIRAPLGAEQLEQLARAAGAKAPLEHLGTGMTAEVFVDARGEAYKVPRSAEAALTIAEEAKWLEVASQVPFVKDHVARFVRFDPATGVLVREAVLGQHGGLVMSSGVKGRLDRWDLHREISRLMKPYGFGQPEYKAESYVRVRGRGWVLFDAGFALRFGHKLLELVPRVDRSPESREGGDLAFAIVQESGRTIPAPIAAKALARLRAVSPSAREYLEVREGVGKRS